SLVVNSPGLIISFIDPFFSNFLLKFGPSSLSVDCEFLAESRSLKETPLPRLLGLSERPVELLAIELSLDLPAFILSSKESLTGILLNATVEGIFLLFIGVSSGSMF